MPWYLVKHMHSFTLTFTSYLRLGSWSCLFL